MRYYPEQASNFAHEVDLLYFIILGLTIFFTAGVVIAIIYLGAKYRAGSRADRSRPPHHNTKLELAWTIIPFVIGVPIFAYSAKLFIEMYSPKRSANALNISVVGKQWMWHIQHPTGQRENNELHIPLGRDIKLTMIAQDVIHSFFIPEFRLKKDVVPGRFTTFWFRPTKVGKFYLFCAEYCGTKHSEMIGHVYVMTPEDYEKWLEETKWGIGNTSPTRSMEEAGEALFNVRGCAGCHGVGKEATAPSLVGLFGKERELEDGRRVIADEDYIRRSIYEPDTMTVKGYQKLMPSYMGQIEERQVFELIEYIKSLGRPKQMQPKAAGEGQMTETRQAGSATTKSEGNQ